jgi:hypothetical protein
LGQENSKFNAPNIGQSHNFLNNFQAGPTVEAEQRSCTADQHWKFLNRTLFLKLAEEVILPGMLLIYHQILLPFGNFPSGRVGHISSGWVEIHKITSKTYRRIEANSIVSRYDWVNKGGTKYGYPTRSTQQRNG